MVLAGPGHAEVLAVIHQAAFPAGEGWEAGFFAGQLALPGHFAVLTADAAGFVLVRVLADEAEVLAIAVLPGRRRLGVGRALLLAGLAHAAGLGAGRMYLEVSVKNVAAETLYRSIGFTEIGRRRRYYPDGSDAIVLSRAATEAM